MTVTVSRRVTVQRIWWLVIINMSVQKLIILGILKEGPKHGYEIKKIIKEKLGIFASLENESIYYPLKIMEQQGLISKDTVPAAKRRIRYVYTITPAGSKKFISWALAALLSQTRPFIEVDIPLYFLPDLETKEVISRLKVRRRFLDKVKQWFNDKLAAGEEFLPHQEMLLRHHLNLLIAEENFCEEMVKTISCRPWGYFKVLAKI